MTMQRSLVGEEPFDHLFKVILLGDRSVGKTALIHRYIDGTFTDTSAPTEDASFKLSSPLIVRGKRIVLQIWDLLLNDRFRTPTAAQFRGTQGVFFVYDITDTESFTNLTRWRHTMDSYCEDASGCCVGTKCDLEDQRAISVEQARELCLGWDFSFFEASAKCNTNIEHIFFEMACSMETRLKVDSAPVPVVPPDLIPRQPEKKKFYNNAAKFLWELYWPKDEALKLAALEKAKSTGEYILNEVGLTTLPKHFGTGELSGLTCVNLSKNNMPYFPVALCRNLSNTLCKIIFSHNYISWIPAEINRMGALTTLDLSYNCILTLPDEIGYCDRLVDINLENNALTTLPPTLSRVLQNPSATVKLSGNRNLDIPSSIYSDRIALLHYLLQAPLGEETRWNQVKLVILGPAAVGKTSLCHQLHGTCTKIPLSTDGVSVNLTPFTINNVEFCSYDFGGQVILQETHQFFLTGRSLFVLVFNLSRMHEAFIEFYLTQIVNLVPTTKPPLLLVGTHADVVGVKAQSMCKSIQQQFKNRGFRIVDCLPVNARSGSGFPAVKSCLVDVVTEFRFLREKIKCSWVVLHNKISLIRQKTQTMQWSQFCEMAVECGIDSGNISNAALFFHEVGSLIYYRDKS
ncbi:GTP-binding protein yptV1 [Pelomyxa schiedti]|nr:GTP-binding protein yptV1 [Pelomyxa schiedti]